MKKIILNRKDGRQIEAQLKELDINYIDKIMDLQKIIYNDLEDKNYYACSEKDEFEETIKSNGKVIGCLSMDEDELIAIGVYIEYGYKDHNYGYDLNIEKEELLKVGQVESTIVKQTYRGNGLQKMMCEIIEDIAIKRGMNYICATVAPKNIYSLDTFKKLGYNIITEKLKYGGLNRYVLMKNL